MTAVRTTYDNELDILRIETGHRPSGRVMTKLVATDVGLEYSDAGRLIGVKVVNASRHVAGALLAAHAEPEPLLSAREAQAMAARLGIDMHVRTIRRLITGGTVRGTRRGRSWMIGEWTWSRYLTTEGS